MKRIKDYTRLTDYQVGDRVHYMSFGKGEIASPIKQYGHLFGWNILLDEPAPKEFNMGHADVIAISVDQIKPIAQK